MHLILAFLLIFSGVAFGQSAAATGTISGVVTDASGGAVPNATVTVKNTDFTSARTLTTDDSGAFAATFLPAGNYTVEVKAPGFQMKRPARLTLGVGSSVRVNVRLELAQVKQEVTVTGTAPTVEGQTTAPTVNKQEPVAANTIAGLTVTYLPNRNRDFGQFAQLAAGVDPDADENGLVVAGQRPEDSKMSIDGADFNDPLNGGQRGARDGALFFPQTVVREFQIVHAGATAEVGGTNAGFVNVVTKSGANKKRAEGFFIGRPATLTSRDAFGQSLDNQQYEFGGSVGGPIKKDRAFFYFGAEQDILRVPYWFQPAPLYPAGSLVFAPTIGPAPAQIVSHTNPTAIFLRTDYILGPSNTLAVQFNVNRVDTSDLNTGSTRTLGAPSHQDSLSGDSEWLRGSLTTIFSPTTVNQVLGQWSRDQRSLLPNSTANEQSIVGFAVLGGDSRGPDIATTQRMQWSDDMSISRGGRQFRVGGLYAIEPTYATATPFFTPRYDYASAGTYLAGAPFRVRANVARPSQNPVYDAHVQHTAFYTDAKLPLASTLTATLGFRWEGQWNPQPPRPNPLLPVTSRIASDSTQFQPRLGLAWNPHSDTVVRASAGMYDAATPANVFRRVFVENGVNTVLADTYFVPAPTFAAQPQSALTFGIEPGFRNPRSFQIATTVEQQLGTKVNASIGYLRNSTWALPRLLDENLAMPTYDATGMPIFAPPRPHSLVGQMLVFESNAHSSYDGLLVTTTFQLPRRSTITANYTLSHTRDDDSGSATFGEPTALDPFNLRLERADSNLDIRHNFNVNAVINLPVGLKFNPIVIARSGAPYTPIVGVDTQHDANDLNDRAVVNGHVVARNSFRQPSFFNLDFRFVKDITLRGEGHHLDLFLDVFNVTGAANRSFGPDAVSVVGNGAAPVFSAFQPLFAPATTRYGSARQVQFTARLVAF